MDITFVPHGLPESGTVIVTSHSDGVLSASAADLDRKGRGFLKKAIAATGFEAEANALLQIPAPVEMALDRVILLGLGEPGKLDALSARKMGGKLAARLEEIGVASARLMVDHLRKMPLDEATLAAEIASGAGLRRYRFDRYYTDSDRHPPAKLGALVLAVANASAAEQAHGRLEAVADGVRFARDLVSEPANILTPPEFARRCRALESVGVEVTILDETELAREKCTAILGVGQGSAHESRLVVLEWKGAPKSRHQAPVALLGKGVTFDAGGISLKPGQGMEDMKFDMAGAAAVCGAMRALAQRRARCNVVGILGLVENMPSGTAQRPGDIIPTRAGLNVEIINTDAEGRLVLADCLDYARDHYAPAAMIDIATLTGSMWVALGFDYGGLFTTDDALAQRLIAAGEASGDSLWRLPLNDNFDKQLDSDIADIRNTPSHRWAGGSMGGQFIKRFAGEDPPWAHIDIAGVAWKYKEDAITPKGASGFGVRLFDQFLASHYE